MFLCFRCRGFRGHDFGVFSCSFVKGVIHGLVGVMGVFHSTPLAQHPSRPQVLRSSCTQRGVLQGYDQTHGKLGAFLVSKKGLQSALNQGLRAEGYGIWKYHREGISKDLRGFGCGIPKEKTISYHGLSWVNNYHIS